VSFVPDATDAPSRAYDVNILGFGRLISEIMVRRRAGGIDPTVLVVGSAEQYGRHDADAMPLDEETVQRPLTVYAASKAAQEVLALQAWRSEGVRVIATRSFNHSGVGHAAHFLIPALVSRTLRMRRQGAAALSIGNGDVIRDFTHVADVAEAYARLVEQGQPGEVYNVCCGEGTSVRTLAERILHRVGLPPEIAIDPALVRRVDVPALVGSNAKLRRDTAWAPARTLDDIIDDLIHAATH